jgi:uncharacterized protein (DUF1778 family)
MDIGRRRLAAIAAADVVGFSRLVGLDEETFQALLDYLEGADTIAKSREKTQWAKIAS